jgi:hypothetical protein
MIEFIQSTCGCKDATERRDDEQESGDATVSPWKIIFFFLTPNIGLPG